jgi:hypothetical protein
VDARPNALKWRHFDLVSIGRSRFSATEEGKKDRVDPCPVMDITVSAAG